jgi:hypothetical protein
LYSRNPKLETQIAFGEAGRDIITTNLNSGSEVNALIPGKRFQVSALTPRDAYLNPFNAPEPRTPNPEPRTPNPLPKLTTSSTESTKVLVPKCRVSKCGIGLRVTVVQRCRGCTASATSEASRTAPNACRRMSLYLSIGSPTPSTDLFQRTKVKCLPITSSRPKPETRNPKQRRAQRR